MKPTVKSEWNMCCPQCGSDCEIDIASTAWVRLTPDGTDADIPSDGGHSWDSHSGAKCAGCGFSGNASAFETAEEGGLS